MINRQLASHFASRTGIFSFAGLDPSSHNKRCVYIESLSASGMRRALGTLSGTDPEVDVAGGPPTLVRES